MHKIVTYLCLAILLLSLLSLWEFYLIIRPIKINSTTTPKDFGIYYESIAFKTEDDILIKAWFVPHKDPQAPTIILLHGYPADKGDILASRLFLHMHYNLLFLDFRYLGESQGNYSTLGKKEILDLEAALKYLHTRGIHKVGVWGFSLGAAVALLSAPNAKEIKAIVAEAPFARLDWMAYDYHQIPGINFIMANLFRLWGWIFLNIDIATVEPITAAAQLKIPLLLVYSKRDQVIRYHHALLMQEVTQHKPLVELIILDHTHHGESMQNYQHKVNDFFSKNLK